MNDITVYTTNTCPYCTMVKNFLDEQGLSYKEVNVQQDQRAAQKLVETTGQMGVPQINVNGKWVLGFDPNNIMANIKQ
ncbi:glutaredoxin family protein [Bacillus sp. ISL-47]|uniref:glutaredoxin family protein n=1 Tax=Bacillus sp. ISL-47 TaxID=2819130 RepID=UPI001BECEF57|nr:glutaredoxin family protein [Bacillus sp. ISL-47]MBT2691087.1 glutaredoxin family protein [Bacillus sp. ISL-47]MBT2707546.1 glutaredoxin family protein [Pseudomonas sp. ISL-84]